MDPRIARAIVMNVAAVGATVWYFKVRREERAKRAKIALRFPLYEAELKKNADLGIYTRNRISELRTEEDVQNVIRNQE